MKTWFWVLGLVLALAGCDREASGGNMGLEELAAKLGLRFPADTELLEVRSESGGMDDALFVKVAFGTQGWATFVLTHLSRKPTSPKTSATSLDRTSAGGTRGVPSRYLRRR